MDNGLETNSTDIAMSLLIQNGVPYQDLAGTSPTKIWGWDLQKRMRLNSWSGEKSDEKMILDA